MKRFSAIAAIALYLLVFSGCSNEGAARKAAVADFSADAVITYGGETEKAFLTSDLKGISLLIGSGNLKDVKYSCDGKSTEIFCDGVALLVLALRNIQFNKYPAEERKPDRKKQRRQAHGLSVKKRVRELYGGNKQRKRLY